jgi:hypothetical protein
LCHFDETAEEALTAATAFTALGKVGCHCHFFGDGFRVLVQEEVEEVGRNLIFVVGTANGDGQGI